MRTHRRSSTSVRPHELLFGREAGPECQIADRASRVVEAYAATVEASPDRRLVNTEGSFQHVLSADIEQQIAKIMVPIRPGGAIVIEDAVDHVGLRIERQVVKAEVAVDQCMIAGIDRNSLIEVDDILQRVDQTVVVDDAREAFSDPGAGLRPGNAPWQPSRHVRFVDPDMLFGQDRADRTANLLRQLGIALAALVKAPRIAPAGNHSAEVEAAIDTKSTSGT